MVTVPGGGALLQDHPLGARAEKELLFLCSALHQALGYHITVMVTSDSHRRKWGIVVPH